MRLKEPLYKFYILIAFSYVNLAKLIGKNHLAEKLSKMAKKFHRRRKLLDCGVGVGNGLKN